MPVRLHNRFVQHKGFLNCHVVPHLRARRSYSTSDEPKVIFSGIQPTGVPHLGNYLGALQQWVKLQDTASPDTSLIYSVVDLHAITVPQNAARLRQCKREMLATLLAIGLDPKRSTIFYQSSVCSIFTLPVTHIRHNNMFTDPPRCLLIQSSCGF